VHSGEPEATLSPPEPDASASTESALAPSEERTEQPTVPVAAIAPLEPGDVSPLELRVRRLEDALAQLQAGKPSEVRPAERFTPQPDAPPSPPGPGLLSLGRRWLGKSDQQPKAAAPAQADPPTPTVPVRVRGAWFLLEALAELRAIYRMYVDPRYKMSWTGWVVPLLLLAAIVTSYWWMPGTIIPVFGYWLNKIYDLVFAYALCKILSREARRYRETAPDLPSSLRL
jgi:hypothetical protein